MAEEVAAADDAFEAAAEAEAEDAAAKATKRAEWVANFRVTPWVYRDELPR